MIDEWSAVGIVRGDVSGHLYLQIERRSEMPLVMIRYKNASRGLAEIAEKLAEELPAYVAPALSTSGDGQLNPDDIPVWITEGSIADVNTKDLEIIIWAHEYPERRADLEERKDLIVKRVCAFLDDHSRDTTVRSGFVWILLQPTAFGRL